MHHHQRSSRARAITVAAFSLLCTVYARIPLAPALSWHAIRTGPGTGAGSYPEILTVDDPETGRMWGLSQCSVFGSGSLLSLDDRQDVVSAGCYESCPLSEANGAEKEECMWPPNATAGLPAEPFRGVVMQSRDAGLTWSLVEASQPELLNVAATFVTVKKEGRGLHRLHCRIGGFELIDRGSIKPDAVDHVACSVDGRTWVRQRVRLPEGRAQASATVFAYPGEVGPRIFLFGGAKWSDNGVRETCTTTVLVSNPIDLRPPLNGLSADHVTSWTDVDDVIPRALKGRFMPVAYFWPGFVGDQLQSILGGRADVMGNGSEGESGGPGLGWTVGEGDPIVDMEIIGKKMMVVANGWIHDELEREVWVQDVWCATDPLNASTWARINFPGLPLDMASPTQQGMPLPTATIIGDLRGSTLGNFPLGAPLLLVFPRGATCYGWSGPLYDWTPVRSSTATTITYADFTDRKVFTFSSQGATSVAVLLDDAGHPVIVTQFGQGIMRAFSRRCNHTCPSGMFATRCGLDPDSPMCSTCLTCPGSDNGPLLPPGAQRDTASMMPSPPFPSYASAMCRTSYLRNNNMDTECTRCSPCTGGNVTVVPCTPYENTVCGLQAAPLPNPTVFPIYVPEAPGVTSAHSTALLVLPVVAGMTLMIAVGAAVWIQCGAALCCRTAGKQVAAFGMVNKGQGPPAPGMGGTTSPAVQESLAAYLAARDTSIAREKRRATALWALTATVAAVDVSIALLSSCSLVAFGLSLVWGDHPAEVASTRMPASFLAYGNALLAFVFLHALVVGCRAVMIVASRRLHMDTPAMASWLMSSVHRLALACASMLVPVHSRLLALVTPSGPLQLPLPARVHTALATLMPASFLLLDLPALLLICGALQSSGIPVESWSVPGTLAPVPRAALLFASLNLLCSVLRMAWDVAQCVRSGGVFRTRHALANMPAVQGLIGLLLPGRPGHNTGSDLESQPVPASKGAKRAGRSKYADVVPPKQQGTVAAAQAAGQTAPRTTESPAPAKRLNDADATLPSESVTVQWRGHGMAAGEAADVQGSGFGVGAYPISLTPAVLPHHVAVTPLTASSVPLSQPYRTGKHGVGSKVTGVGGGMAMLQASGYKPGLQGDAAGEYGVLVHSVSPLHTQGMERLPLHAALHRAQLSIASCEESRTHLSFASTGALQSPQSGISTPARMHTPAASQGSKVSSPAVSAPPSDAGSAGLQQEEE